MNPVPGIHHVTAIASDPQKNLDFYTRVLGLRLVKLTVNYDDPFTYHFYFGDYPGSVGTILTFFPWPSAVRGTAGNGEVAATSFRVASGALDFWADRFAQLAVSFDAIVERFGETVLPFEDTDGMRLELVTDAPAAISTGEASGDIPGEHQIVGFHGVTIQADGYERTAELLVRTFGYQKGPEDQNRFRFHTSGTAHGRIVDLLCTPGNRHSRMGAGSVHHVAFRATSDGDQANLRGRLVQSGFNVTPQLNRNYFRSIYFREPGGVIFEVATDQPGFALDEPLASLGESLKLPEWLEPRRTEIEDRLPRIRLTKK